MFALRFGQINIQGFILRAHDKLVLSIIEHGILWIKIERFVISVERFDIFGFILVIKFEQFIFFEEQQSIGVVSIELELDAGVSKLPVSQLLNLIFARGAIQLVNGDFGNVDLILDLPLSDDHTNLLFIL